MSTENSEMVLFTKTHAALMALSATIQFDTKWNNGTGYLDYAAQGSSAPVLEVGEMVASVTDNSRRVIFVGTPVGNMVVFDRFEPSRQFLVSNQARALSAISGICNGKLNEDDITNILGNGFDQNIGKHLMQVYHVLNRALGGSLTQQVLLCNSRSNIRDMDFTVVGVINDQVGGEVYAGHKPAKGDSMITLYQVSPVEEDEKLDITGEELKKLQNGGTVVFEGIVLQDYTAILQSK